jgi:hypothetical protein
MTWSATYTGGRFDVMNPRVEDIKIEDIAHALSFTCRFNGHCTHFYSVAQHSMLVTRVYGELVADKPELVDYPQGYLCALLHDAAEAYVGDVIRPIKLAVPGVEEIEKNVREVILEKFYLAGAWHNLQHLVQKADLIVLATEARDIMHGDAPKGWDLPYLPHAGLTIHPRPSVKGEFLGLFNALLKQATLGSED